jgi:hypothetical protein
MYVESLTLIKSLLCAISDCEFDNYKMSQYEQLLKELMT